MTYLEMKGNNILFPQEILSAMMESGAASGRGPKPVVAPPSTALQAGATRDEMDGIAAEGGLPSSPSAPARRGSRVGEVMETIGEEEEEEVIAKRGGKEGKDV